MIVANPFWRYPIALAKPTLEVSPLIEAIRRLDVRPFRIVSHEREDGKVFNAAFFEDQACMQGFLKWYGAEALSKDGAYQAGLSHALAPGEALPTSETLLFGKGSELLADTRFGEYQLGMAVRYSRGTFRSAEIAAAAMEEATRPEFEERIAAHMQYHGVSYFGRLVMLEPDGSWLSVSRYGSVDDADRGTAAVQQLMSTEVNKWFSSYESIYGTATRVMEL